MEKHPYLPVHDIAFITKFFTNWYGWRKGCQYKKHRNDKSVRPLGTIHGRMLLGLEWTMLSEFDICRDPILYIYIMKLYLVCFLWYVLWLRSKKIIRTYVCTYHYKRSFENVPTFWFCTLGVYLRKLHTIFFSIDEESRFRVRVLFFQHFLNSRYGVTGTVNTMILFPKRIIF